MKNYKIVRIGAVSPYNAAFESFYYERKLESLSYEQAVNEYCKYGYIFAGHWSHCMKKLGNDSIDLFPDFPSLQKKWANENKVIYPSNELEGQVSLLFKQIETIKPDVIFLQGGGWTILTPQFRKQIKLKYPFIKVITGLWGDPLPPSMKYSHFQDIDVLFCAYEYFFKEIELLGIPAVLHGYCFDPEICMTEKPSIPEYNFTFAGSSGYGFPDHIKRYSDLIKLIKSADLKIWCYEPKIPKKIIIRDFVRNELTQLLATLPNKWLKKLEEGFKSQNPFTRCIDKFMDQLLGSRYENRISRLIGQALKPQSERYGNFKWDISLKPIARLFPDQCFPPKFGIPYFEILSSSKIVYNRHTGEAPHAGNIRMFEVTGMGSCLITDNPNESKRFFDLETEIVTYSCVDECIEKVKYLLQNEKKRKEIADRGKKRTLRDHTVMSRCSAIHDSIQKWM